MTAKETSRDNLSPLDQIRQTEAEVTRRIAAARQAAERIVAEAMEKAAQIKVQARQAGLHEGQAQFREIVSRAEEEAQTLVVQAQRRAEEQRHAGEKYLDHAVSNSVDFILGKEKTDEA